jgi:hypothetical protein
MHAKAKRERRSRNEFTLVERRGGNLWAYLQIPVCAVLIILLIRLVH